jgi:hypothetical protein
MCEDPKNWGTSTAALRGSWYFGLVTANGDKFLRHSSPDTLIKSVIEQGGGNPETHVAKFGSKTLELDKTLEYYKLNTNGAHCLGDSLTWDGKLHVVRIIEKTHGLLSVFKSHSKKEDKKEEGGNKTLSFFLKAASNLPAVDGKSSDPYVLFSLTSKDNPKAKPAIARTKSIQRNLNPKFGETIILSAPWLTNTNFKQTLLTLTVFDSNKIQKDIYIGEASIDIESLAAELNYNFSVIPLFIPLNNCDGWLQLYWNITEKEHPVISVTERRIVDGPHITKYSLAVEEEHIVDALAKRNWKVTCKSLSTLVKFLASDLYQDQSKELITAQLNLTDEKLKETVPKLKPELLDSVQRIIFHVDGSPSQAEVKSIFQWFNSGKNLTKIDILDLDTSMAVEWGMISLAGNKNITQLRYVDDKSESVAEKVIALGSLLMALPSLTSLALVLSAEMQESTHMNQLLTIIAACKSLKTLSLEFFRINGEYSNLNLLKASSSLQALNITSCVDLETNATWRSLLEYLPTSSLSSFSIDSRPIPEEDIKQLINSLSKMSNLKVLNANQISPFFGQFFAPVLAKCKTLSSFTIRAKESVCGKLLKEEQQSVLEILKAVEENEGLEELVMDKVFVTVEACDYIARLPLLKKLKLVHIVATQLSNMVDNPNAEKALIEALLKNNTLTYACFGRIPCSKNPIGIEQLRKSREGCVLLWI